MQRKKDSSFPAQPSRKFNPFVSLISVQQPVRSIFFFPPGQFLSSVSFFAHFLFSSWLTPHMTFSTPSIFFSCLRFLYTNPSVFSIQIFATYLFSSLLSFHFLYLSGRSFWISFCSIYSLPVLILSAILVILYSDSSVLSPVIQFPFPFLFSFFNLPSFTSFPPFFGAFATPTPRYRTPRIITYTAQKTMCKSYHITPSPYPMGGSLCCCCLCNWHFSHKIVGSSQFRPNCM